VITVVTGVTARVPTVTPTAPDGRTRIRQLSILLLKRQHLAPGSSHAPGGEVCGDYRPRYVRKFRYAFDGVGPRCPWYFEPSGPEP
jgi:hypothetical protein